MAGKNDGKIRCSFCGKTQDQVNRLISGPERICTANRRGLGSRQRDMV